MAAPGRRSGWETSHHAAFHPRASRGARAAMRRCIAALRAASAAAACCRLASQGELPAAARTSSGLGLGLGVGQGGKREPPAAARTSSSSAVRERARHHTQLACSGAHLVRVRVRG